MKHKQSLNPKLTTLLLAILCQSSFGAFDLRSLQDDRFCQAASVAKNTVNYMLSFTGEELAISVKADYLKDTLFLGTHFIVKRNPLSFSREKLLSPYGIGKISGSNISDFKVDGPKASFSSFKKLPFFNSLNCSNSVQVYTFKDYLNLEAFTPFLQLIDEDRCIDKPFIVTHQEVFNCNNHFERSTIISFYFAESRSTTRILTYSFSEMSSKVNFIERNVMKGEIKKTLKNLPQIIESL
ncbi:MAG: hypothetical protein K9K67_08920 [Bacteriovoracaceae bacterium]|nr:hypothetical protein [Bacteriovoracaceae bacterium]